MAEHDIKKLVTEIAQKAKKNSYSVMKLSTIIKNKVLADVANGLRQEADAIIEENKKDLALAEEKKLSKAMIDRLMLDKDRIDGIAKAVEEIINLEDPAGQMTKMIKRPNGLKIAKVRVPIGVIGIIYESRPNVTIDAFVLSFKAGNSVILRGGSESFHSNMALSSIVLGALKKNGVPESALSYIPVTDRQSVQELIQLDQYVDLIIPRGGHGLIKAVTENSRVPVIKHDKGLCHIFIDSEYDTQNAIDIVLNAKIQRPGVCNAVETLLIHKNFKYKKAIIDALVNNNVEVRCDKNLQNLNSKTLSATDEDWDTEYLDYIISVKQVDSVEEAIDHINTHSSHHSESILTKDYKNSQQFLDEVDSAAVYANASTRFTDGGEFGLGAEIGISTNKLHSRGPMGLEDLTTQKFIIWGNGQIR